MTFGINFFTFEMLEIFFSCIVYINWITANLTGFCISTKLPFMNKVADLYVAKAMNLCDTS